MAQELDAHGQPVHDDDEKKVDDVGAERKEADDIDIDGDDEQKGGGLSADEDDDDNVGTDSMSDMMLKKKKMAMNNGDGDGDDKNKKKKQQKQKTSAMDTDVAEEQNAMISVSTNDPMQIMQSAATQHDQGSEQKSVNLKVQNTKNGKNGKSGKSGKSKSMKNGKGKKGGDKWEVNKQELYRSICGEIVGRCRFLLSVVSVQPELSLLPMGGMTRSKSMEKAMSSTEKGQTAALTAWQHMGSQSAVKLKYATPEQRPSLIWKYVLSFLDEQDIDSDLMKKRVHFDRIKSRLRSFGLEAMRYFLCSKCTKFAILRREMLHFLMPSLFDIHEMAFSGKPIEILHGLTPIGSALTKTVNHSLKRLLFLLKVFSHWNLTENV